MDLKAANDALEDAYLIRAEKKRFQREIDGKFYVAPEIVSSDEAIVVDKFVKSLFGWHVDRPWTAALIGRQIGIWVKRSRESRDVMWSCKVGDYNNPPSSLNSYFGTQQPYVDWNRIAAKIHERFPQLCVKHARSSFTVQTDSDHLVCEFVHPAWNLLAAAPVFVKDGDHAIGFRVRFCLIGV